jgi:hypothetical protein
MTFQEWCLDQLKKDALPGELFYPQYNIGIRWVEDIKPGYKPHPASIEGLPPGRFFNGTSTTKMYKEELDTSSIKQLITDWWAGYSQSRPNAADPVITVEFYRFEVWCLDWFNHWTFDIGKTNDEVLESFRRYVQRIERANEHFRYCEDTSILEGREEYFCLMGAEDTWRWHGEKQNDCPPCRCQHCKEQGVIRIGH